MNKNKQFLSKVKTSLGLKKYSTKKEYFSNQDDCFGLSTFHDIDSTFNNYLTSETRTNRTINTKREDKTADT